MCNIFYTGRREATESKGEHWEKPESLCCLCLLSLALLYFPLFLLASFAFPCLCLASLLLFKRKGKKEQQRNATEGNGKRGGGNHKRMESSGKSRGNKKKIIGLLQLVAPFPCLPLLRLLPLSSVACA